MKVHPAVIQRILDNCDFSVLDIIIFMFINNSFFSYGLLYYNYKFVCFYGVSCKEIVANFYINAHLNYLQTFL